MADAARQALERERLADLDDELHGGIDHDLDEMDVPVCTKRWEVELPEACICLALSPKGRLVAAATAESEILVVDAQSGAVRFTLPGHRGGTNRVAFLSGATLASCGEDGAAKVWNVARSACVAELELRGADADRTQRQGGCSVQHLAVAPSAGAFACASGRSVALFTVAGEGASAALPRRRDLGVLPSTVEGLRYDTRGNLLAAYNGGVTVWHLSSRTELDKQALDLPYDGACLAADMSPDQSWVVAGCHDASCHIFHFVTTQNEGVDISEMSCGGYDGKVTQVDFSPGGGRWMASLGGSRPTVWDFQDSPAGSVPILCVGHGAPVTCQAWQSLPGGGLFLLTGCRGGRVLLFDVEDAVEEPEPGHPKMALPAAEAVSPGDEVTALLWGTDGWFFSGHVSSFLRGWRLPLAEGNGGEEAAPAAAEVG